MTLCVVPLSFEVVTSLSEIDPNHGVARTMPLRLGFVAEWRKRDRLRAACTAQDERSGQQRNRKPKQPSMAGKQTRGLSKREDGRHIEEFQNARGRPDAVRFRDRTGIAKCDVSAT